MKDDATEVGPRYLPPDEFERAYYDRQPAVAELAVLT